MIRPVIQFADVERLQVPMSKSLFRGGTRFAARSAYVRTPRTMSSPHNPGVGRRLKDGMFKIAQDCDFRALGGIRRLFRRYVNLRSQ